MTGKIAPKPFDIFGSFPSKGVLADNNEIPKEKEKQVNEPLPYRINYSTEIDRAVNLDFVQELKKDIKNKTGDNNLEEKVDFVLKYGDINDNKYITREEADIAINIIKSSQYSLGIIYTGFNQEKAKQEIIDYRAKHYPKNYE